VESSAKGRIPDFFVVGHTKTGTTALYHMLSQHPRVFLGEEEPRYFAAELLERDMPRPGGTPKTLAAYMAWFRRAAPDQLVGDISPEYLWSESAAARIAEVAPDAKIIAIFREPASFLLSLHRQFLQVHVESETDFARALALESERREGRRVPVDTFWPRALFYSDHVRYVEQLRRYEAHFPAERMLVLIYDDYRRDNEGTLRSVLRFLGLEDDPAVVPRRANPSVQIRAPRTNALLRRLVVAQSPSARALKGVMTTVLPMRLRQRTLHATRRRFVWGEPTPPPPELMLDLRRRLKPEVAALSEHLGRDLVGLWGYGAL
jgi:Sulfotransferase family